MSTAVSGEVRRILVFRPSAVGDFVFALPCLQALKSAWPQAHLAYVGRPWHEQFLTGRPGPVDEVLVLPPCPGIGLPPDARVDEQALQAFVQQVRSREFDLALQVFGGGRHANPLIRRLGAGLCAGFRSEDAPPLDVNVFYGFLQNRRLQLLELAGLLGAQYDWDAPELQATDAEKAQARQALRARGAEPLVVIQPAASDRRRCWPAERFAAVADHYAGQGALVAINGTAQESDTVAAVLRAMRHKALDLTGRLSLPALTGLLAQAQLLVSNDTGPLHLALALGTPAVGIYWLSNLIESGPLRQQHHRALMSVRLACPVCGMQNLRQRCEHDVCFVDDVSVAEVLQQARMLL